MASGSNPITVTFTLSNRKYTLDENGKIISSEMLNQDNNVEEKDDQIRIKLSNGEKVILDKTNVSTYIGKEISDYKESGQVEEIKVGSKDYNISTTYRLYYIDFDGKYDEKGTIFLKADYVPHQYVAQTEGDIDTSKLEEFNSSSSFR